MNEEISELERVEIKVAGRSFFFNFRLSPSMIDGKILTIVNGSKAASNCPICQATPKEMNKSPIRLFESGSDCIAEMQSLSQANNSGAE